MQSRGPTLGRAISIAVGALAVAAIPFSSASAGTGAKPSSSIGNTVLTGTTSQGAVCGSGFQEPCTVSADFNNKGTRAHVELEFTAQCDNGSPSSWVVSTGRPSRINSKGRLNARFVLDDLEDTDTITGQHGKSDLKSLVRMRFRYNSAGLSAEGTMDSTVDVTFDNGTTTHCATGPVSYSLKPS